VVLLSGLAAPLLAITVTPEVDLGGVEPGTTVEGAFSIGNDTDAELSVELLSSDPSLTVSPAEATIEAGGEIEITVTYRPPDDVTGELVRIVTVLPDTGEPLAAVIRAQGPEPTVAETAAGDPVLSIDIYMDSTCPKCRALVDDTIPEIVSPGAFRLNEYDVLVPEYVDEMMARLNASGLALDELPVAFVETGIADDDRRQSAPVVFQGFERIEDGIAMLVAGETGTSGADAGEARTGPGTSGYLTVGAIVGAGLLDGINPCAFSTMLFLISMLALAGRSRREILVIGIVYSLTVFVGYVAAGFGLFAGVRTLMVFPVLVSVMRWTLFALLIVLAGLSIRDAVLAGQGRTSEMSLQLPDSFKRRVHKVVRTGTRSASLVGGTILLGIGVTVFEFSCTGQVYVPVIMHLARTGSGAAVGLLLLYNLAFIVPLLIVFGLAYAGVSMKRVGNMFAGKLVLVKLGLAIVFAGFAALTVLV
jgi:hypothetical protein